ncbi:MAG: hypothetical protein KGH65_00625 [Candidatus Micrarchaeota archaeon]|nr:hypothetical protein [Candidatus Micrarchaeota archaeon]
MKNGKKPSRNELMNDYKLLDKMSREIILHQKNIKIIRDAIAKKVNSDVKFGLIENLDVVMGHMKKAMKEMDDARKELKEI